MIPWEAVVADPDVLRVVPDRELWPRIGAAGEGDTVARGLLGE